MLSSQPESPMPYRRWRFPIQAVSVLLSFVTAGTVLEAILLIVGELVFAILAPFVAMIAEAIGAVISAVVALATGRRAERPASSRVARVLTLILVALTGLVFAAVCVANFVFFDDSVRYVLGKVESRTGIVTDCDDIDGSLLSGRVELRNCAINRSTDALSSFELEVAEVSIDLEISSLLGTATLETARVAGLTGWVRADRRADEDPVTEEEAERPRRRFEVKDLQVFDASVELSGINPDGNTFNVPIEIERLEIQPLRSRLALFDVLFRSRASGTLGGAPFELESVAIADGRRTEWRAQNVPIASFGSMTGGVLSWFSSGFVDVYVDDEWQRGESTAIDMDWRLQFSGIEVAPPPGTGRVTRFVTAPLTRYVNSFDGEFPLEFELVLNEGQFEYKSSLAAAGVWSAIGEAANNAMSVVGIDLSSPESTGETLKKGMKSILDRVRKPEDQDED